jgi:hypothetical protein
MGLGRSLDLARRGVKWLRSPRPASSRARARGPISALPLTAELRSAASPREDAGRGVKWLRSPRPASSRGEGAERSEAGEGGPISAPPLTATLSPSAIRSRPRGHL